MDNFGLYIKCILTAIFIWLIYYGTRPIWRLHKSGFKHPICIPFFGTVLWIYIWGFQKTFLDALRKLGRVYAVAEGQSLAIVISDPVILKDILIKSFSRFPNRRIFPLSSKYFAKSVFTTTDDEWRWARRTIIPTFTTYKMKTNMYPLIYKCAQQMLNHMKSRLVDRMEVTCDTKDLFGCFTMDVISSTAFGLDINSFEEHDNAFAKHAKRVFSFEVDSPIFAVVGLFPFLAPLLKLWNVSIIDEESMEFFAHIVEETVSKRQQLNIVRNDYLQTLIDSNKAFLDQHDNKGNTGKISQTLTVTDEFTMHEDQDDKNSSDDSGVFAHKNNGLTETHGSINKESEFVGLSTEEYVSNALLFFIAGYESTANALCWITRTLAWYPDVQEKLRNEVLIELGCHRESYCEPEESDEDNLAFSYDAVSSLRYMDMVVREVLRLYPPIVFFDRTASQDYVIPGTNNLLIKKGTPVIIPILALHKDPSLWENPDQFNPERFKNQKTQLDNDYKYMPFGAGPRNCIGLRFALLEIKVGLAIILMSRIKFTPAECDIHRELNSDNTRFKKNGINFPSEGLKISYSLVDVHKD